MARTPQTLPVIDTADTGINTDAVGGAMDAMREQVQEDHLELLELASDVGALRALELTRSFVAAATVQLFDKVRDSKRIKDLPIRLPDGTVATATTVDEFCRLVFGKPRTAMIEASETLEALGESAYDLASRMGLNRSALRAARALPPEKLEAVRLAISSGSSRAEVLSVIEDLAEKIQKAEVEVADLRAEREADEQVRGDLRKKIDKLEREKKRVKTETPDEVLAELAKEANAHALDALGSIRGRVRHALQALADHGAQHGGGVEVLMAGILGQLQAEITGLRELHSLPDVSSAADAQLASEVAQWAGTPPTGN